MMSSFFSPKIIFPLGCPKEHSIINETKNTNASSILTDSCSPENEDAWFASEEAVEEDAEIILDLGCIKNVYGLHMKNLNVEKGGTKVFRIFLSEYSPEGPWNLILTDEFLEESKPGCATLKTFNLE